MAEAKALEIQEHFDEQIALAAGAPRGGVGGELVEREYGDAVVAPVRNEELRAVPRVARRHAAAHAENPPAVRLEFRSTL